VGGKHHPGAVSFFVNNQVSQCVRRDLTGKGAGQFRDPVPDAALVSGGAVGGGQFL